MSTMDLPTYYKDILSTSEHGVLLLDPTERVVYLNEATEELLGVSEQSVGGLTWKQFCVALFGEVPPTLAHAVRQALELGATAEYEVSVQRGGKLRFYQVGVRPVRHCDIVRAAVATLTDVTQQVLAKRQLERASVLTVAAELAAGVVHEIKNPITSIRGFTQLLQKRLAGDEQGLNYLELIVSEIDRATDIVSRFLAFCRPADPRIESVDVVTLLQDMVGLVEGEAMLRQVTVRLDSGSRDIKVCADVQQLKQVLLNLMTNALAAMPGGGELTLHVKQDVENGMVGMVVSDTGSGMDAETLKRLGEPFFSTKPGGNGLGLSISFGIVRLHGGRIDVESAPGKGSTLTAWLPAKTNCQGSTSTR